MKATVDLLRAMPDLAAEVLMTAAQGAPNPAGQRASIKRGKPTSKPPTDLTTLDALRPEQKPRQALQHRQQAVAAVEACWRVLANPETRAAMEDETKTLPPEVLRILQAGAVAQQELAEDRACQQRGDHLLSDLGQCVRAVVEHAGRDDVPELTDPPTWNSETQWLLATAHVWQTDDWLNEYVVSEVTHVHHALAQLARVQREKRPDPCKTENCPWPARLIEGGRMWVCEAGHENAGPEQDVEHWRWHPTMTSAEIEDNFPITRANLRWHKKRRNIKPAPGSDASGDRWHPWDVMKLIQPELCKAVEQKEQEIHARVERLRHAIDNAGPAA